MQELNTRSTILTTSDIDRIIEMAWEDRTTFESIEVQFGLPEKEVIALMRKEMKASSFKCGVQEQAEGLQNIKREELLI
jgi:uncharacterized protein (TIGR03643 family)